MYWLKNKIKNHLRIFKNPSVNVYRNYNTNTVVIDYYGGACTKYTYDGKWIAG